MEGKSDGSRCRCVSASEGRAREWKWWQRVAATRDAFVRSPPCESSSQPSLSADLVFHTPDWPRPVPCSDACRPSTRLHRQSPDFSSDFCGTARLAQMARPAAYFLSTSQPHQANPHSIPLTTIVCNTIPHLLASTTSAILPTWRGRSAPCGAEGARCASRTVQNSLWLAPRTPTPCSQLHNFVTKN